MFVHDRQRIATAEDDFFDARVVRDLLDRGLPLGN